MPDNIPLGAVKRHLQMAYWRSKWIFKRRPQQVIDRLPTELLIQVFLHCLSSKSFPRPSVREAPILLTRVCRRWRALAPSVPQLWAAISLGRSWSEARDLKALDVWINRSQSHPLCFSFTHSVDYRCYGKLVQEILPQIHRWKAFYCAASDRCRCFLAINKALSIPNNALLLNDFRFIKTEGENPRVVTVRAAPQMSTLYVGGDSVLYPIAPLCNKFHAMRELRIHKCPNVVSCLHTVNRCPSLQILEIAWLNHPYTPRMPHIEMHSMPHLHTFLVTGSLEKACSFIECIQAPSLLRLTIFSPAVERWDEWNIWEGVVKLIKRSVCHLEEFRVDGMISPSIGIAEVLRCTPSLKSLTVGRYGLILTHMDALKPSFDMSYTLCPQLNRFEFLGELSSADLLQIATTIFHRRRYSQRWSQTNVSPQTVLFELKGYIPQFISYYDVPEYINDGMTVAELDCSQAWWVSEVL
ncbi:hypothetical protein BD410DRAFT_355654 [Rickenella mellea]|uniref:Uncharacterized protein n=1 Tax=Rickenella mellea TaxID=50990 RepID=A0A4Y7PZE0_9AGAM|nr:hypothetical protein BD410DRAFT_355654 [Rickenella mellea]